MPGAWLARPQLAGRARWCARRPGVSLETSRWYGCGPVRPDSTAMRKQMVQLSQALKQAPAHPHIGVTHANHFHPGPEPHPAAQERLVTNPHPLAEAVQRTVEVDGPVFRAVFLSVRWTNFRLTALGKGSCPSRYKPGRSPLAPVNKRSRPIQPQAGAVRQRRGSALARGRWTPGRDAGSA